MPTASHASTPPTPKSPRAAVSALPDLVFVLQRPFARQLLVAHAVLSCTGLTKKLHTRPQSSRNAMM